MNRDLFIQQAKAQPEVSSEELSQGVGDGTLLFRFLGKLFREHLEFENNLVQMDLVSEEGRMKALRQQGIVQGRAMLIENMVDMFLEGDANDYAERDLEPEFELTPRRAAANAAE